ncbi:hypothetical protein FRB90_004387, partial [Tulasnella sp. 427]
TSSSTSTTTSEVVKGSFESTTQVHGTVQSSTTSSSSNITVRPPRGQVTTTITTAPAAVETISVHGSSTSGTFESSTTSVHQGSHGVTGVSSGETAQQIVHPSARIPVSISVPAPVRESASGDVAVTETKITVGKGTHDYRDTSIVESVETSTSKTEGTSVTVETGKSHSHSFGAGVATAVLGAATGVVVEGIISHTPTPKPSVSIPSVSVALPPVRPSFPHLSTSSSISTTTSEVVKGSFESTTQVQDTTQSSTTSSSSNITVRPPRRQVSTTITTAPTAVETIAVHGSSTSGTFESNITSIQDSHGVIVVSSGESTQQVVNVHPSARIPVSISVPVPVRQSASGDVAVTETKITVGKETHDYRDTSIVESVETSTSKTEGTSVTVETGKSHSHSFGAGVATAVLGAAAGVVVESIISHTPTPKPSVSIPSVSVDLPPVRPSFPHLSTSSSTSTTTSEVVKGSFESTTQVQETVQSSTTSSTSSSSSNITARPQPARGGEVITTITTAPATVETISVHGASISESTETSSTSVHQESHGVAVVSSGEHTQQVVNVQGRVPVSISVPLATSQSTTEGASATETKITVGKETHEYRDTSVVESVETSTSKTEGTSVTIEAGKSHSHSFGAAVIGGLAGVVVEEIVAHTPRPSVPTVSIPSVSVSLPSVNIPRPSLPHFSTSSSVSTTTSDVVQGSFESSTQVEETVESFATFSTSSSSNIEVCSQRSHTGEAITTIATTPATIAVHGTSASGIVETDTTSIHQGSHGVTVISSGESTQQIVAVQPSGPMPVRILVPATTSESIDTRISVGTAESVTHGTTIVASSTAKTTDTQVYGSYQSSTTSSASSSSSNITTRPVSRPVEPSHYGADGRLTTTIVAVPATVESISVHGSSVSEEVETKSTSVHQDSHGLTVISSGGRTEQIIDVQPRLPVTISVPLTVSQSSQGGVAITDTKVTVEKGESVSHTDTALSSVQASTSTSTTSGSVTKSFESRTDIHDTSIEKTTSAATSSESSSTTVIPRPAPVPIQPSYTLIGQQSTTGFTSESSSTSITDVRSVSVHDTSITQSTTESTQLLTHAGSQDVVVVSTDEGVQRSRPAAESTELVVTVQPPARTTSGGLSTTVTVEQAESLAQDSDVTVHNSASSQSTSAIITSSDSRSTSASQKIVDVLVTSQGESGQVSGVKVGYPTTVATEGALVSLDGRSSVVKQESVSQGSTVETSASTISTETSSTVEGRKGHSFGVNIAIEGGVSLDVTKTIVPVAERPSLTHSSSSISTSSASSNVVTSSFESETHAIQETTLETSTATSSTNSSATTVPQLVVVPTEQSSQIVSSESTSTIQESSNTSRSSIAVTSVHDTAISTSQIENLNTHNDEESSSIVIVSTAGALDTSSTSSASTDVQASRTDIRTVLVEGDIVSINHHDAVRDSSFDASSSTTETSLTTGKQNESSSSLTVNIGGTVNVGIVQTLSDSARRSSSTHTETATALSTSSVVTDSVETNTNIFQSSSDQGSYTTISAASTTQRPEPTPLQSSQQAIFSG